MRAERTEDIIKWLEENEELRMKFYKVMINHAILQTEYLNLKGDYHRTIELRGLYESKKGEVVNEDYYFLLNLLWNFQDEEDEDN